jgi:uncharacterized protein YcnI
MMKICGKLLILLCFFLLTTSQAAAHVVVKPNEVGVGAFQTFTIGVPVEKDIPTTGLRVVIPQGLKHVSPNVKPGWTISIQREGEGDDARVTEVSWTGGIIPEGQRDDFLFSAQVPSEQTTIIWKAYQTYQDGTVISWDQDPNEQTSDDGSSGPYSQTGIINDLAEATPTTAVQSTGDSITKLISVSALVLAVAAIGMQLRKK